MHPSTSSMEPLLPSAQIQGRLEDLAAKILAASATLEGQLLPATRPGVMRLLRVVNSYYSNLIEGNATHPIDIERAMREEYAHEPDKRDRQIESRIHIAVQEALLERVAQEPTLAPAHPEFLCWLHKEFYRHMPETLCWQRTPDLPAQRVIGGELRQTHVQVGQHIAPAPDELPAFLDRFAQAYDLTRMHGLTPYIAVAAAHHRLMWIHPFLDGNGRVARLFTDAWFHCIPLPGYGLWNVSRGLARRRDEYREKLAAADAPREGDLDGRGALSQRRLIEFCEFFLSVCLDQVTYMSNLLRLDGLAERVAAYVRMRNEGLISGPSGQKEPFKPGSELLLQAALVRGEYARGEAASVLRTSERQARRVLSPLLAEGLLASNTEKAPVRLGFPAHAAGYLFPDLYPPR